MYTHCPHSSIFKCIKCNRNGDDCLQSCRDCRAINKLPLRNRTHLVEGDQIFAARILCKRCSLFHLKFSLGARLFNVKIFRDKRYPEQVYPTRRESEKILKEEQKTQCKAQRWVVARWFCTACQVRTPRGYCSKCKAANVHRSDERIQLVNGHLHLIDQYCRDHNLETILKFEDQSYVCHGPSPTPVIS